MRLAGFSLFLVHIGLCLAPATATATTFAPGFSELVVVTGLNAPTGFVFLPDNSMLVTEKDGTVRRTAIGGSAPHDLVLTLPVNSESERGLLGIVLDPAFATNGFIYLYYTTPSASPKNRVSRFTWTGTISPASEVMLVDNIPSDAGNHNAGGLQFGPDGKLYISTGDGGSNPQNSQSLATLAGKILRVNSNGSIPADNPFVGVPGVRTEIWCYGLRNPWRFVFDGAGRLFIGDVGGALWEEINIGAPGRNFGWPNTEGPTSDPAFTPPVWAFFRGGRSASITGGAFPNGTTYPEHLRNVMFFGDYATTELRILRYDPSTNTAVATLIATDAGGPVHFAAGPEGRIYYVDIISGQIRRIHYSPPSIVSTSVTDGGVISSGQSLTFGVNVNPPQGVEYQFWKYSLTEGAWTVARPWSPSPAWTWVPQGSDAGFHYVQVWVRYEGYGAAWEDWRNFDTVAVRDGPARIVNVQTTASFPLSSGSSATWTVTTIGGIPPVETQFWRYDYTTQSWVIARPYSSSNSYTWTPGSGDGGLHVFQVWARSAGTTIALEDWRSTDPFTVTTPVPFVHDVRVTPAGPVQPGTLVTISSLASGGTAPLQYQFWKRNNSTGAWTILCPWSTASSCAWTTTASDRGGHFFQVWVRNAGAVDVQASRNTDDIVVSSVTSLTVAASVSFPAPANSSIAWTAAATSTLQPVEYAFWLYRQQTGTWTLVQGYSTSAQWTWTPSGNPGTYVVQVWSRSAGSAANHEAWVSTGPILITP